MGKFNSSPTSRLSLASRLILPNKQPQARLPNKPDEVGKGIGVGGERPKLVHQELIRCLVPQALLLFDRPLLKPLAWFNNGTATQNEPVPDSLDHGFGLGNLAELRDVGGLRLGCLKPLSVLFQDAEALEEGCVGFAEHGAFELAEGREVLECNGWDDSVVALHGKGARGAVFANGLDDALILPICFLDL